MDLSRLRSAAVGAFVAAGVSASGANAQELRTTESYHTTISANDRTNSRGKPLADVCATLQQDRANVHKFGNPDGDHVDGSFAAFEERSLISKRCMIAKGDLATLQQAAANGEDIGVRVFVQSVDGELDHVVAVVAEEGILPTAD